MMTRIRTRTCAGPVQPDGSIPYTVWLDNSTLLAKGALTPADGYRYTDLKRAVENPLPYVE